MGSGQRAEVTKLIKHHLRPQGFHAELEPGGHWRITNPRINPAVDKRRNSIVIPCSPGTSKHFLNIISRLRNELDFVWNGRGGSRGPSPMITSAAEKRQTKLAL